MSIPAFASQDWYVMVQAAIDVIYTEELNRLADNAGKGYLMYMAREHDWMDEEMRAWVRTSDEWAALHPPVLPSATIAYIVWGPLSVKITGATVTLDTGQTGATNSDGYVAFQAATGTRTATIAAAGYLDQTSVIEFTSNMDVPIVMLTAAPPPAPLHPDPLVGGLRYGDRCYADQRGPVNVSMLHAGDWIGQALIFGVGHIVPGLDLAASAGYHGLRSWFQNHQQPGMKSYDQFWANQPVPSWDPRDNPTRFVEILRAGADRGLTWHLAGGGLEGLGNTAENAIFDLVADAIGQVGPQHFSLIEALNEDRDTGDPDDSTIAELDRLIQRVRSRYPQLLYSLSAHTGTEDRAIIAEHTLSWSQHYLYHNDRGGRICDKLRHIFSMGYSGEAQAVRWLGWAGEPWGIPGPLVSVQGGDLPDGPAMVMGGCMAALVGQTWTYMCSPGVIYGSEPLSTMPGFFEVPATVRTLPRDLAQFAIRSHSGPNKRGQRIHADNAAQEVRADYAIHADGRYVEITYGPKGTTRTLPQERATTGVVRLYDCPDGHVDAGRLA